MGYYVTQADSTRVWVEEDGKSHSLIETITGAQTLTAEDSGKTFILSAAAGAAVSLPAVTSAKGFKAKFIIGSAFATTAWTVVATTAVINGGVDVNSTYVACANKATINFSASAETIGDFVELECNGVNWFINGVGALIGAITFP
jgi:hypothetical protein